MDSLLPIPPGIRNICSRALIDVGTSATRIGSRLWETEPSSTAPLSKLLNGQELMASGFSGVSLSLAAGTDQFHAFAQLMRTDVHFGPSLATLARSTIESLGRGWWLLSADSAELMRHRATAMGLAEARAGARHGVAVRRFFPNGRHEAVEDPIAAAQELFDAARIAGEDAAVPRYGALARAILEAAGVESPAAVYSHLSGAAHGERSTVGGLGSRNPGSDGEVAQFKLRMPIRNARMYCWVLIQVLDVTMVRLINLWDVQAEHERWAQSYARSADTLEKIFAWVLAYEPSDEAAGTLYGPNGLDA
ncbi:hypothetical protein [Agrococcus sp. SCSIO52902]|uniref:hypothetical protein n=1 Tax=Agrococcus sp. SCSIO52902 TaxID=2933290 RepID=UPI001FF5D002|nr:hypothetical protein [Agrococcus sp. SCSIO52902]UOW00321.1 hypothetical protein MU522_10345 [Agrococcus sp. SCSIO52902]